MSPTDAAVWRALGGVQDPEFPLSVVDLGMVYGVETRDGVAHVSLSFTSIGCPAIDMITSDVREAVGAVPEIEDVRIEIVWDPPWSKDRISERGRRILAVHGVVA